MMRWRAVLVLALMWVMGAATAAPTGWFGFEMNPAALSGAPDVSALNRPLDAASRIVVRDGHFYRVGADGQPATGDDARVRFFGVNLTFGANFPDPVEATVLARQLRKLGFNAVRLHHLDSLPSDYPDAPISILTTGPFPTFSPTAVARLRGLIEALGLRGNPALAMVELNNESSLLAAWLGPDWLAAIPSAYAPELRKQWRAWLMQRHGSLAQACAVWGGCAGGNDNAVEFPVPGQQQPLYESGLAQLRSGIARRVNALFGSDAKPDLRERDFLLFLAATDQAYFERLRRVVHESADPRVPVTGTQMGYGGLLNFDSQVAMDYIDEHFYVGHPDIRADNDWRIPELSASGNEFDRVLALSLRRDAKRPFVVSEFNQPFPNPRGAEILPLMSAVGALQDWDGLFYFDYSDAQRLPQSPSRFALSGDWGRLALAGQSARLFRQPLLAALPDAVTLPVGPQQRLLLGADRRFDAITTGLADGLGVKPQWALQGRLGLDLGAAPGAALPGLPNATPLLTHDASAGRIVIDAPALWAVFGATGTGRIGGQSAWMQFDAAGTASAMLTALDGQPLAQSRHLLLSLGNDTTGTQPGSMPARPKMRVRYRGQGAWSTLEPDAGSAGPSGSYATRAPAWLRRTPAMLGLAPRTGRLSVYPLDGEGRRRAALPAADAVSGADGVRVRVQTRDDGASPWYELVFEETR